MRKINYLPILVVVIALAFWSCTENKQGPTKIAISKTNLNYSSWIERNGESVEWINMYPLGIDSALKVFATCDGLLVTGGEDIFTGFYGKLSDTVRCGTFDRYRDSLELALIEYSISTDMPVFGVCRGLQILNVALGGTLIIDIPEDYDTTVIHRQEDWQNCYHKVNLEMGSQLFTFSKVANGIVNSNHHQGIENLGNGLVITSFALDSLPESIEWENTDEKGFLMAVQWHPERMEIDHPLSKNPAMAFLNAATEYKKSKR